MYGDRFWHRHWHVLVLHHGVVADMPWVAPRKGDRSRIKVRFPETSFATSMIHGTQCP